jgi:hypothetical protein
VADRDDETERSYQDDLNTAALADLLGVPPFVAEEITLYLVEPDAPLPCGMQDCTRDADYFVPVEVAGMAGTINVASCIEHLPDMAKPIAAARDRKEGD